LNTAHRRNRWRALCFDSRRARTQAEEMDRQGRDRLQKNLPMRKVLQSSRNEELRLLAARLMWLSFRCKPGRGDMSDRKKLMALRDASVDARRKAALGWIWAIRARLRH
jgi:hypothetical protein